MADDQDGFKNWFNVDTGIDSKNEHSNMGMKKCGELSYSLETKNAQGEFEALKTTDRAEVVNNKYL